MRSLAPPVPPTGWPLPQLLLTFAVLVTLPLWISRVGLYPYLGVEILIWMIYALGFNLLLGYAALPSFGHGAFFGIGAYAFGLLQQALGPQLWLGLGAAILAASVAGAVVASFISHRRGIYYALLTIAFGQIAWFVAIKWHGLTGGEDGLLGIPRPPLSLGSWSLPLAGNEALFYFVLAIFACVTILLWRLVHSPFGKIVQATRQNELRAGFVGYHVWLFKWLAFVVSTAVAGLAGGLFAMAQQSAYPDVMSLHASGFVVMMTLIGGGLVSFWGPILGAALFFVARDVLGAATDAWLLWYGLLFMAVVLFKPEGLAGLVQDIAAKVRRHGAV